LGVGDLGLVADSAEDVGLARAVSVFGDGVAQGLAVDGQRLVAGAVGLVPALQGAVELAGVDAAEHIADDGLARHGAASAAAAAADSLPGLLGQVPAPLGPGPVPPHAAPGCAGGQAEPAGPWMAPPLAAAGALVAGCAAAGCIWLRTTAAS